MSKSMTEEERKAAYYRRAFQPLNPDRPIDVACQMRSANAIEYIAAQLGMIREMLEKQGAKDN